MKHFFITWLMVEWNNRDSVVYLISKGVHRVVNDYHILHVSVGNNSQIFHVIPFRSLDTVLTIKSILEKLIFRINIVKDCICIRLVRRCENYYLK